jgi:hypothetical protein
MAVIRRKRPRRPVRAKRSQGDKFRFDISAWNLEAYDNLQEIFESTVRAACNEALEYAVKDEDVHCFLTDEREYGLAIELPLGNEEGPYWTIDLRDVFFFDMMDDFWRDEHPEMIEKWRDFFAEAAEKLTKVLNK